MLVDPIKLINSSLLLTLKKIKSCHNKTFRADVVGVIVTGVGDTILHLISLSADKSLHPPPDWSAGPDAVLCLSGCSELTSLPNHSPNPHYIIPFSVASRLKVISRCEIPSISHSRVVIQIIISWHTLDKCKKLSLPWGLGQSSSSATLERKLNDIDSF